MTFSVIYDYTLLYACKALDQTSGNMQIKWAVSLVIADGYLIFLGGLMYEYVWVNIHFITPKDTT